MRQAGLFGLSEHLERLSKDGDPLKVLEATVDFEHVPQGRARSVKDPGWSRGSATATAPKAVVRRLTLSRCSRR